MIEINIPGYDLLRLEHLVSDVNGTLTVDGQLLPGVSEALEVLRSYVTIHLLTADTLGRQDELDCQLNLQSVRIHQPKEAEQKADYVHQLGAKNVVAIGQGANDTLMIRDAALGICVLSAEGCATQTLMAADIVVPDILSAFHLLQNTLRTKATLRR